VLCNSLTYASFMCLLVLHAALELDSNNNSIRGVYEGLSNHHSNILPTTLLAALECVVGTRWPYFRLLLCMLH